MPYKRYKDKEKRRRYLRNYMRNYRKSKVLIDKQILDQVRKQFPDLIPKRKRKR